MSKRSLIAVLLAVIVISAGTLAARNKTLGIEEQRNVILNAPTVVGGTLLPAGTYSVQHQMNGQIHVMVFKQVNGTAEAKANCNLVPLTRKADTDTVRYVTNAKNERVLQEMTFSGDSATHVLVP